MNNIEKKLRGKFHLRQFQKAMSIAQRVGTYVLPLQEFHVFSAAPYAPALSGTTLNTGSGPWEPSDIAQNKQLQIKSTTKKKTQST